MSIEQREVVEIATGKVETALPDEPTMYGRTELGPVTGKYFLLGYIYGNGWGTHAYHLPEREPQADRIRADIATTEATLATLRRALAACYAYAIETAYALYSASLWAHGAPPTISGGTTA